MKRLPGIKTEKDVNGRTRFLRIDLNRHGSNELLEDFLDVLEVEKRKNEPRTPLEEFVKIQNEKRGLNV
ncbi:hypothetical protein FACS1894181_01880 [Bacteroidia bacterium]|nr:hypothetical protein FACS1894181_01880 [Bacteroidia bacterium]